MEIVCGECGKTFEKTLKRRLYCSDECAEIVAKRKGREAWERQKAKNKEKKAEQEEKRNTLLDKEKEARSQGISYGELQKRKYMASMPSVLERNE